MFTLRRPSGRAVQDFLEQSRTLPLSYDPIGIALGSPRAYTLDETVAIIGRGSAQFERAMAAIRAWKHFDLGWVTLAPEAASIDPGTDVAVIVRHLGFWSMNGCRVVYARDDREHVPVFGFAYGTLPNHAERGEELFEVSMRPDTLDVVYRIRAVSKPRALLARAGYPVTRSLQAKFRRDSVRAMRRAVHDADL